MAWTAEGPPYPTWQVAGRAQRESSGFTGIAIIGLNSGLAKQVGIRLRISERRKSQSGGAPKYTL